MMSPDTTASPPIPQRPRPRMGTIDALAWFIATSGGLGCLKPAPGTWGSLAGVAMAWLLRDGPLLAYGAATVAVTALGIWATARAQARWQTHDDQRVVIDEVAGYLLTTWFIDRHNPRWLFAAFIAFRIFDITKPWLIRRIDRQVDGALGVMADDLAAGLAAGAGLALLSYLGGIFFHF